MYLGVGGVGVAGWRVVLILSYAQVGVEFPKMKFWFFEFTWLCKVVLRQKTWKAPNLSHAIYWYCLKLQLPTILLQWMDGDLTYKIKSWLTFFFTVSPATNIGHISTAYCSIRPDHTRYVICSACNSYKTSVMKRLSSAVCWKNASNNNHLFKKQIKE